MGYTILVAEDDRDIVELIELYLENDGYRVLTAVSYTHLTLPTT